MAERSKAPRSSHTYELLICEHMRTVVSKGARVRISLLSEIFFCFLTLRFKTANKIDLILECVSAKLYLTFKHIE